MSNLIKVVAIDDEPDQSQLLKIYLEEHDPKIRVESFTNPHAMIHYFRNNRTDIIILDQVMPEITGIALARKIRRIRDTPFILYTGKGSEELAVEAFEEGITYYMRKEPDPRHYKKMAKRIREIVESHRPPTGERPLRLPDSPSVSVRGEELYIVEEDGSEHLWGEEGENAGDIARVMELELRAMYYVRDEMADLLTEISENLCQMDIPRSDIPDIIYEGYRKLQAWFKALDRSFDQRRD